MGSCISKCRPKKSSHSSQEEEEEENQFNLVQDKLVIISQPPPKIQTTPLKPINKISSPSPPATPSVSTSSAASSLITRSSTTNTATSRSISSSSATSSKEYYRSPSFSNELLSSYYKENPHIIRINSNKENSIAAAAAATTNTTLVMPVDSTLKKRVRSSSPSSTTSLSRKKSFRRDYQNCRTSTRSSSSPSPSRGFVNGDLINLQKQDYSRRQSKRAVSTDSMSFSRRESISLRAPIPKDNMNNYSSTRPIRPCLRNTGASAREQYFNSNIHRIGSKINEIAVAKAVIMADQHEIDAVFMEDVDNPLISLDCFIFI